MDIDRLLEGHEIVKLHSSGMDHGINKSGCKSKHQTVSKTWLKNNIDQGEYTDLMSGESITKTVKRGRGYSWVIYSRIAIKPTTP